MRILVACEESGIVTKAFRVKGHEAYSCDLMETSGDNPEWHIVGDITEQLKKKWDMIIAFPPCTYLTISANKWYKDQPKRKSGTLVGAERRLAREKSIKFFMYIANSNCGKIAIENPVGVMSTRWRKPDQVLQPWMFGHPETKATCLWLKGVTNLIGTKNVYDKMINLPIKDRMRLHYLPKTKDRATLRSKTFQGVAKQMAEQWG